MAQFNAPAYDIERPTGQCAFMGHTLEPGEPFMATLVEVPDTPEGPINALGLKRVDISMQAWEEGKRPEKLFGYWKTRIPEPNRKKRLFVDNEILMNLFIRLADSDQPQRLAFRFVLGLILMRKKLLRYDHTEKRSEDGPEGEKIEQEWWMVTPKLDLSKGPLGRWDPDRQLEMLDPRLDEQQIQQVTEQIGQILEAEIA